MPNVDEEGRGATSLGRRNASRGGAVAGFGGVVRGWTTIMILVGLGSSAQLLMTGILGEYVGRIYEEVKRRPLYVVGHEVNLRGQDQTALSTDRSAAGP